MKKPALILAGILLSSVRAGRPALLIGALYEDQAVYFRGLTGFLHDMDAGRF